VAAAARGRRRPAPSRRRLTQPSTVGRLRASRLPASRPLAAFAAAVAFTVAAGWAAGRAGLPSGYLFAALIAGLALALARPGLLQLPRWGFPAAQAVTGVVLGTYLRSSTLSSLGSKWIPVALMSLATLVLTTAAGLALGRLARVDRATASLGMVAGGASGIVAMAGDLGGDDRLVAFMQYLRVLVVVLLTPLVVRLFFGHQGGAAPPSGGAEGQPVLGTASGWLMTALLAAGGAWVATRVRLPAGALLGPLLLAAVLTLTGVTHAQVPPLLRETGFGVIGLQVGLRFTPEALRQVGRLLVPVLVSIVALIVACLGLAWVLSETAHVSLLDAYLATTPGGLFAVIAAAFGSGADTTFVLAVQGLRLLVMVLAAPVVVRWLLRGPSRG
jgi:membrane AbrB-like protein